MRCPKCGFHSFDYLDACKKCSTDLRPFKTNLGAAATAVPMTAAEAAAAAAPASPVFAPPPAAMQPAPPASAAPAPLTAEAEPAIFAVPDGINLEETSFPPSPASFKTPAPPPGPAAAAATEPLSFDFDMLDETKIDIPKSGAGAPAGAMMDTPIGAPMPPFPPMTPPAPKVQEFNLDFGAPAAPSLQTQPMQAPPGGTPLPYLVAPAPRPEAAPLESPFPAASAPAFEEPLSWEKPAAAAADPLSLPRAGFWIRFAAQIIDGFILNLMIGLVVLVLFFTMDLKGISLISAQNPNIMIAKLGALITIASTFATILHLLYFTYFHGRRGQTPGKQLLKLKVIRTDGGDIGYLKSFIRYLGYIVNQITFCIGYIWAAFDKNKQGLHDKIAGTYVVRLR